MLRRHAEPVMLVGQTGCGKTTVCQMVAAMRGQRLHIINCNQHTEASDFLGGFRPVRDRQRCATRAVATVAAMKSLQLWAAQVDATMVEAHEDLTPDQLYSVATTAARCADAILSNISPEHHSEALKLKELSDELHSAIKELRAPFVWVDGPLVEAMRRGDCILIDEINLADDAVLERLNSVLESGRTLTLAEKGGEGAEVCPWYCCIVAIHTMRTTFLDVTCFLPAL